MESSRFGTLATILPSNENLSTRNSSSSISPPREWGIDKPDLASALVCKSRVLLNSVSNITIPLYLPSLGKWED
jgi:hypothetical protein